MIIEVVKSEKDRKDFLKVPKLLYKNDPNWTCPLDGEINAIFDPEKNSFFNHGTAIRWILKDSDNKLIGRIAAFINDKKAYSFNQPTGGCGFFECINDKDAAFFLFDTAKAWLEKKGMKAMDGPVNFGENDNHWGLLVDGYMPQGIGMPYHHPYYKDFFYDYGFKVYFEQYSYHLDPKKPFPARFWKIAEWVAQKPGFSFKHFSFDDSEKFISDIINIYSEAWKFHENFTPLNPDEIRDMMNDMKMIVEEKFIWFAYHEDKPIAFLVMVPDVNQALRHINGKLNLINKLKLLYHLKNKTITRARITVMGVVPKFQRAGVESAIFWHLDKVMKTKPHYNELELSWVGDFNPKMKSIYEAVGGVHTKTHQTLRCIFDPSIPFERAPMIVLENRDSDLKTKN